MTITEKEWKAFTAIKDKALERYCQSILDETTRLCTQTDKTPHERYLELWQLIKERNKTMGKTFDGHSRSRAMLQLMLMRSMDLVDEDELQAFDPDSLWDTEF